MLMHSAMERFFNHTHVKIVRERKNMGMRLTSASMLARDTLYDTANCSQLLTLIKGCTGNLQALNFKDAMKQ